MKKKGIIILIIGIFLILTGSGLLLFMQSDNSKGKTTVIVLYKDDTGNILYQKQVKIGDTAEKIEPDKREGLLFVDWYQDSIAYNFDTKVTKDLILTGKWEEKIGDENSVLVVFYNDDDTLYESQQIVIGENAKEPSAPTSEIDGEFIGWFKGEEQFDFESEITEKTILKAKYLEKQQDILESNNAENTSNLSPDDPDFIKETDIQVSVSSITMRMGEEVHFTSSLVPENATIRDLLVYCEDSSVCSANAEIVRGVSPGSTSIIFESFHGIKKTIPITVKLSYEANVARNTLYITSSNGNRAEGDVVYKIKSTGEQKTIHVPLEGIRMEEDIEIVSVNVND